MIQRKAHSLFFVCANEAAPFLSAHSDNRSMPRLPAFRASIHEIRSYYNHASRKCQTAFSQEASRKRKEITIPREPPAHEGAPSFRAHHVSSSVSFSPPRRIRICRLIKDDSNSCWTCDLLTPHAAPHRNSTRPIPRAERLHSILSTDSLSRKSELFQKKQAWNFRISPLHFSPQRSFSCVKAVDSGACRGMRRSPLDS